MENNKYLFLEEDEILNEVYFKKNSNIEKMENIFQKMIDYHSSNKSDNMNKTPFIKEMAKTIENEFNFEKVHFTVSGDALNLNAHIYPYMYNKKIKVNKNTCSFTVTDNGIRYNKKEGKTVLININVANLEQLTARENMSIILHEIGHGFFVRESEIKFLAVKNVVESYTKAINNAIVITKKQALPSLDTIMFIVGLIVILIGILQSLMMSPSGDSSETYLEFLEKMKNQIDNEYKSWYNSSVKAKNHMKKLSKNKLLLALTKIKLFAKVAFDTITFGFLTTIISIPIRVLINRLLSSKLNDYDNEKFADNFAISYGFGKECAEVFNKFGKENIVDREIFKSRLATFLTQLNYFRIVVYYFGDPHPSSLYRIKNTKKKLQYELSNNKNLSQEDKKDIQDQIDYIDKYVLSDLTIYNKFCENFNKYFNLDKKRDDSLGYSDDEEIYDFDKKLLKKI